jgi:uncharacterized membrane protein YedE/YeeE
MHPFLSAVIGGALIGFSAVLLMFLSGRIAGISGIVGAPALPHNVFVVALEADQFQVGRSARSRLHC